AFGNRARSASDPEKPAHHFLAGADLCERAVPPRIQIDLECLGMGIDRFVFHGVRTEMYQESRRGDSYMFVKSERLRQQLEVTNGDRCHHDKLCLSLP